jgi:preprotein translocase subunit SecE
MSKIINYLKETRGELKHVAWPTRKQSMVFTILVIVISVLSAFYLGFFDYLFSLILEKFVL